jgi:glycosyltransferase involved in cell wall biosynthesis
VNAGAKVIRHPVNQGVLSAIKTGVSNALGDIIVTLDADGQHNPSEIPLLIKPILDDTADVVIGVRPSFPYFSEKILSLLTNQIVDINDACSGFRAIKKEIAEKMELHGLCLCGTFILEAYRRNARIMGVPITIRDRENGERRIKSEHFKQFFIVIWDLLRFMINK